VFLNGSKVGAIADDEHKDKYKIYVTLVEN
jgi:hypothetical protein